MEPLRAAVLSHGRGAQGRAQAQPGLGAQAADAPAMSGPSARLARRVQDLLDEAEIAADEGDWAQAAEWLRDALVLDPEDDDALALLAMATRRMAVAAVPAAQAIDGRTAATPIAPEGPETPAATTIDAGAPNGPETPAATTIDARAAGAPIAADAAIEAPAEPRAFMGASLEIAIARWEARGFRLRERSIGTATLLESRRATWRGLLASLVLGVGLGGIVYLVYALLLQPRREIRLALDGDRVALTGDLRRRNPVVVALDVVAGVAAIAALGLLAVGGAQLAGLL